MKYLNLTNMRNMGGYMSSLNKFLTFFAPNKVDTGVARGVGVNTYTRASGAYIPDFEGRLVYVQPNCPSFPGLRAISNLLTYSEDFSNAVWSKGGVTSSVSGISPPSGYSSVYKITEDSANAFHQVVNSKAYPNGTSIASIVVKKAERAFAYLGTGVVYPLFDLNTGTFSGYYTGGGVPTGYSTQYLGDGWYRLNIVVTSGSVVTAGIRPSAGNFSSGYLGDGLSGIYVAAGMLTDVTGATNQNPSEYVPTTSAPVTIWKDYTNPNVVDGNGVVTQIATTPITTGKQLLSEPAGTNLINNAIAPATQSITVTAQQYTLSCMGIGSVTLSGTGSGSITGVSATDIKTLTFTPTAGTLTLTLTGSLTALQVETGGVNTSFMLSSGATSTRATTGDSYQTATNLPASGIRHISLVWTPIAIIGTQYLWSSGTATDHTAIIYDGTNIILRKRVASVNQDAIKALAAVIGTTYTIDGYIYADNSTAVGVNGTLGTPNANTTAIATAAIMELGSFNGASQATCNFGTFKILGV